MNRPLVITDCDEVLMHMVVPFAEWVDAEHGVIFRIEDASFANALKRKECGTPLEAAEVWPLLDGLCLSLDKVYRDKRVQVDLQVAEHSQISMERGALMELLGNLLENAYRLCLGQIRISLRVSDTALELCVEDDGPGVPVHQRERILQRGERVLSRAELGRGAGGLPPVAVHLNVDARGAQIGVAEQLATVLRSAQPAFERIAIAAVGNAIRRGRLA
mgnify:CR=1 FL=1